MSALARYPVPQAVAAGAVDGPRLYFRLEATVPPVPEFLRPLRAPPEAVAAGAVDDPQLFFRLEPTATPSPVLEFLRPQRGLESVKAGAVDKPQLYFRLEPSEAVVVTTGTRRQRQIKSLIHSRRRR